MVNSETRAILTVVVYDRYTERPAMIDNKRLLFTFRSAIRLLAGP